MILARAIFAMTKIVRSTGWGRQELGQPVLEAGQLLTGPDRSQVAVRPHQGPAAGRQSVGGCEVAVDIAQLSRRPDDVRAYPRGRREGAGIAGRQQRPVGTAEQVEQAAG